MKKHDCVRLEYAAELGRAAISFYRGKKLLYKLSKRTVAQLDLMTASLESDDGLQLITRSRLDRRRGATRIALLTEVASLPNVRFHFDVWRGLVRAAREYHAAIATHEILKARQREETARILRIYDPDAVIYLRLSPTNECLKQLRAAGVATVLIHSDEYTSESAPAPILASIIPNHQSIPSALEGRILQFLENQDSQSDTKRTRQNRKTKQDRLGKAVVLAMPAEPGSLRHRRIESVKRGFQRLKNIHIEIETVPDYGFHNALSVLKRHPDALVYCCLSDELAVGVKHFFEARDGKLSHVGAKPLIIGYDGSQLARDEEISSFGQNLDEIGRIAMEQISNWLERCGGDVDKISFRLIETDVYLVTRGADAKFD